MNCIVLGQFRNVAKHFALFDMIYSFSYIETKFPCVFRSGTISRKDSDVLVPRCPTVNHATGGTSVTFEPDSSFHNTAPRDFSRMVRPQVYVTRGNLPKEVFDILKLKCDVEVWPETSPVPQDVLKEKVPGKDALYCLLTDKIDKDVLDAAGPSLKIVATMSVGVDHLDLAELRTRGIRVGYTPDVLTDACAELTVALLLATSRRLFEAHEALVNGQWGTWSPLWMCGPGLSNSTVGIVGLGRIGVGVIQRLKPFNVARFLYTGHAPKPKGKNLAAEFVSFEDLLSQSDFLIITCALTAETKGLFNKEAFCRMKQSAILINTSRGGVVVQDDLVDALKTGKIAAAGLDVMTPEPLPQDHELTTLKNCTLIPHIGSTTTETRINMATLTAQNIVCGLEGTKMPAEFTW